MAHLIDRRSSSRGRSAVNRERFLRRYKAHVEGAVKKLIGERKLADIEQGGEVRVPKKDISEPSFGLGHGGDREFVLPGNREYVAGDRIPRPRGDGAGGTGSAGGDGESEDAFVFSLSREEFMQIFFDDLELPRLARTELGHTERRKSVRAGYAKSGVPANLAIVRTLTQSLARRIAIDGSLRREVQELEHVFGVATAAGHSARAAIAYEALQRVERRLERVPFIDEPDLRYRNRVMRPEPVARAVMFCLMDVSASMDEEKKDLAKRFFTLLYLFLTRKYGEVDLVFIRHTEDAEEVDEDTFFHDTRSGGTVVYSALDLAEKI
ncbi:MAG: YeaH/YhbH family protein, partial [Casimicrobiaceae bacterium]